MKALVLTLMLFLVTLTLGKKFELELETRPSTQTSQHNLDHPFYTDLYGKNQAGLTNKRYLKSVVKEMTNFKDLQYYGTFYIGPKRQPMSFIFDTGSAWIWVPTDLCQDCPTKNKFKLTDNNHTKIVSTNPEVLVYGTGEVGGIRISEDIYMHKNGPKVIENVVMLGIVIAYDLDGDVADGILGLGPTKTVQDRGHFVTALKNQGLIDYEMFSFDFKLEGKEKSKMIFGDIDTDIVSNFHDLIWVPADGEEDYWTLPLRHAWYGNNKTMQSANKAVIDTGSSTLAMNEDNFLTLMQSVLDTGLECGFFIDEKFVACKCENQYKDFPELKLEISGHVLIMEPHDYVACEDNICVILVYNLGGKEIVDSSTIVLGANFLRKFYTVFDLEKKRVGIYGRDIKSKADLVGSFLFFSLIVGFLLMTFLLL